MVFDGPPEFGLGDQTLKGNNNAVNPSHGLDAEKPGFGDAGYYHGFSSSQDAAERGARRGTGTETRKMSRIDKPRTTSISESVGGRQMNDSDSDDNTVSVEKQMELEKGNEIQYRTCSWQKTAALLFSEYICLAIMSFPYSYSVLGLSVKDVCDIGQMLFWGKKWAWYFTAGMFLLNNTFIQGFHCLVGSKYLNTMTNGGLCTVVFSAIVAIVSFFSSLPRTFDTLSKLAGASAFFTFISVLLAAIFAAIEDHPGYGWPSKGAPVVLAVPASGTTFVAGMNAFMNISYTFIGQITLPSFIAEMKEPKDFPKALWAVTIAEIILFSLVGGIVYGYTGTNYNTAPAFGSLGNDVYLKVSFSFMIPTIIFLGVLYASVSARFVFFRLFAETRHMTSNTIIGWAGWAGILAVTWVFAFIIAEVIPFFADLLSLMSSLFDSFFGFIFWGVAYMRMRAADYGSDYFKTRGIRGWIGFIFNIVLIGIGLLFLSGGTYASVQSIIDGYEADNFGGPFTCESNQVNPLVRSG
ncbi:uncharacterized protein MYCFIDRAFT_212957 [Pseudocercospora fijiensis CIRAD86]|uniref:Amino acid transporter transmembrane domain-containing protein n=1 Tax=Pseudocercospora fijiensis (strain CIRAD86) TaxID=383855 RepID=N1Q635_PSEFD|nr:uncharacterized protein MYCFIDRAFT_212957 [Pseudocercospora fijiensis CIRAD86]EME87614.1 hypothetical protein MYCFIDRAFT_212957 [Pseudocercospora fijiensis CIRAD86]